VYVIGVGTKENLENIRLVKNFVTESKPENLVVELWDERFNSRYNDVMKHPKYEPIMEKFYKIIEDEERVKKLSDRSDLIELFEMEYLIGIDIWSFRLPKCRSVLGDRKFSITQKRMKAKERLSDLLGNEMQNVFFKKQGSKDEIDNIKLVLEQSEDDEEEDNFNFSKVKSEVIQSDKKTKDQIYQEVFIDEINQELLK
jgi:hypothetical protein